MAENTPNRRDKNNTLRVALPPSTPSLANILWRWLGVRAVPHLPCRFDCAESILFARKLLGVAETVGYAPEAAWINEILSWPVEWSALHGIAEIKSPVLKTSTRTDATAMKYTVQWAGTGYPEQGAVGLQFPYQVPEKPKTTASASYQRGLIQASSNSKPLFDFRENGFVSVDAMQRLHEPIVTLARRTLSGAGGNVIDLGCGNGALLAKICEDHSYLVPHGVDSNRAAVEHARELLPMFAENFVHGDLFDASLWDNGNRRYALALFMLGRLLEIPEDRARAFLLRLRASSERVLVYAYPDRSDVALASIGEHFNIRTEGSSDNAVALLTNSDSGKPTGHAEHSSRDR